MVLDGVATFQWGLHAGDFDVVVCLALCCITMLWMLIVLLSSWASHSCTTTAEVIREAKRMHKSLACDTFFVVIPHDRPLSRRPRRLWISWYQCTFSWDYEDISSMCVILCIWKIAQLPKKCSGTHHWWHHRNRFTGFADTACHTWSRWSCQLKWWAHQWNLEFQREQFHTFKQVRQLDDI